VEPESSGAAVV